MRKNRDELFLKIFFKIYKKYTASPKEIQAMKKLQKPDDATFCNLFERKMT